jgi:hypothetical protein
MYQRVGLINKHRRPYLTISMLRHEDIDDLEDEETERLDHGSHLDVVKDATSTSVSMVSYGIHVLL